MKQEFVTLPREVVERALECLEDNISYDFSGNPYEEGDELMQTAAANLRAALEQPPTDQQPYLWYDAERDRLWNQEDAKYMDMSGTIPLYNRPQPRRDPLTDEQVMQAVRHLYQSDFAAGMGFPDDLDVARAIEAAHGIGDEV